MTEIVKHSGSEMPLADLGRILCRSGFFKDARDESQAIVKVLMGREIGISPIASMTGIHVIEGKPTVGAHLIAGAIKRHPHYDYRVEEKTAERCAIAFYDVRGSEPVKLGLEVYTVDDAERAGLAGRANWKRHPKAMLFARCIGQGYRTHCPDVFDCVVYAEGEMDEPLIVEQEPIKPGPRDGQVMRRPTPRPIGPDYVIAAADHRALTEALKDIKSEDSAQIPVGEVGRTVEAAIIAQGILGGLDRDDQMRIAKVSPVAMALLVARRHRYVERAKALPADWRDGIEFDADKTPTETLVEAVDAYAIAAELPTDEAELAPLFAAADSEPGPLWAMPAPALKALRKEWRKAQRAAEKAVQA